MIIAQLQAIRLLTFYFYFFAKATRLQRDLENIIVVITRETVDPNNIQFMFLGQTVLNSTVGWPIRCIRLWRNVMPEPISHWKPL